MASDIVGSIVSLKNSIDSLSARIRSTGERKFSSLESSDAYKKVEKTVEYAAKVSSAFQMLRKASDITRAQRAMASSPGSWGTPEDYLKWEKLTRARQLAGFARNQKLSDIIRGIKNPDLQRKYDLVRQYGEKGAEQILAAESDARQDEAQRAFNLDMQPEFVRRHRALVDRYGGDEDLANRAEERSRALRRSRVRLKQLAERTRLDMSDYDLFIHENKAKYGGREYADEAYRKMLLKSMPAFFKDSKLSTKALIDIKKLYDGAKGIPILGPMARMAMAHPTVAAGAGTLGAIQYVFGQSDKANTTVTRWQNSMNLYGKPIQTFTYAAMLAGMTDIGQISKIYGELTARYGDAEGFIKNIGASMGGLSPLERITMAKSLGFDDTTMALVDILSRNRHLNIDESRRVQAYKAIVETQKTAGWRSGSGAAATTQSMWYSLPSMTSGAARDMENFDYIKKGATERFYETIDEHIDKTREAAESLDEAEKSGIQTTNNQTVNNESRAIYIAKVEVPANNPEEFVMALDRKFGGASGGDNRAVLASMGSGFLV